MRDLGSPSSGSWERLDALARQAASEPAGAKADARGRALVVAAAAALRHTRERGFRKIHAAAIAGLVAAACGALAFWHTRPLRYEVYGGQRFASNYVGAPASAAAHVKFSDGTEVDARPGSRLRVDETHRDGASVIVERGTAVARVRHHDRSRWTFSAGPFNVRVIGTKFDLDWDPQGQVVSLTLHEGAVEVESPVGQSHCVVRAGQRFRASLQTGTMTLESVDATPAASATRTPQHAAAQGGMLAAASGEIAGEAPGGKPARGVPRKTGRHEKVRIAPEGWSKLVRRGDFEAVVEQALSGDVSATLRSCSVVEARALADAARYTDRVPLAEQALASIRARFPRTDQAHAAAFLLGRTSESSHKSQVADAWYAQYLKEAGDGKYAADALAGRMRALLALSDTAAARPIAREYLSRFPEGVHLAMARRLAGEP